MRAFSVVVVAVASLLGLGWYFANSQAAHSEPAAITQKLNPIAQPAAVRPVVHQPVLQKQNEKTEFQMPADENEVVGKYVHRQMVYPKGRSAEKHVPMDDDLLVMEGRSEDRLSATR